MKTGAHRQTGAPHFRIRSMAIRVGNFFIIIGFILLTLFVYTDMAKSPYLAYAFLGAASLLFGLILRWTAPKPPPKPSARFGMLRKNKKKEEKKEQRRED